MSVTIGIVANVFNEANALPGWLETHLPFADDIRILHSGPGGDYSDDGTIEILEKWKIPTEFCSIDDGFGVVRTKALRMSPCEYVMLLDCDERFYQYVPTLYCTGESTPHSEVDKILQTYDFRDLNKVTPDWTNVARLGENLKVVKTGIHNQGNSLREILNSGLYDTVCTVRRHWHDLSMTRPTQNWYTDPDWQLRLVRNSDTIFFSPDKKMHEQLVGAKSVFQSDVTSGFFYDHMHLFFKKQEQQQRSHDVAVYDAIHHDRKPPTIREFRKGK